MSSELHQLGSTHPHTTPREYKEFLIFSLHHHQQTKIKVRMFGCPPQLPSQEYGLMISKLCVTSYGRWLKSHSLSPCSKLVMLTWTSPGAELLQQSQVSFPTWIFQDFMIPSLFGPRGLRHMEFQLVLGFPEKRRTEGYVKPRAKNILHRTV